MIFPYAKKPISREIQYQVALPDGTTVIDLQGTFWDCGNGAKRHDVLWHIAFPQLGKSQIAHGSIENLAFEPSTPPRPRGAPPKTERNVALAMAHEWFTAFFQGNEQLDARKAKRSAYDHVQKMWEKNQWPGVADESALKKNINVGSKELSQFSSVLTYLAPDPKNSFAVSFLQEDLILQDYQKIKFNGQCWLWRFGQEQATYGIGSLPETQLQAE